MNMLSEPRKVELIWQVNLQNLRLETLTHRSLQLVQFSCQNETIIFLGEPKVFFFFPLHFQFKKKKKKGKMLLFCDFTENALMPIKL